MESVRKLANAVQNSVSRPSLLRLAGIQKAQAVSSQVPLGGPILDQALERTHERFALSSSTSLRMNVSKHWPLTSA